MKDNKKELINIINELSKTKDRKQVYDEILKMLTYSLAQAGSYNRTQEANFFKIIDTYTEKEQEELTKFLMILSYECTNNPETDVLGEIYEEFNMQEKSKGQIFTPNSISKMLSDISMTKDEAIRIIDEDGYISISDMACGSGRLISESYNRLIDWGIEPNKIVLFADDIDLRCCCMTFIQLDLKGANAIVRHRDSLSGKSYDTFYSGFLRENPYLLKKLGITINHRTKKDKFQENER